MTTRQIQLPVSDGSQMGAYVAQPATPGTFPGVIVGSEIFGVTAHIRGLTERVAALGYVALAPEFYHRHRTAPGVELTRDTAGRERGLVLLRQLQRQEVLNDVQASLDELTRRSCLKVGMLGFSLGGHLAYLAATELPLKAAAVLYGGWIPTTDLPITQPQSTLSLTPGIAEQDNFVLVLVGENDHLIPAEQRRQIKEALETAGVRHEFMVYPGTPHAFFNDEADTFRQEAHDDAWERIQTMLERELR